MEGDREGSIWQFSLEYAKIVLLFRGVVVFVLFFKPSSSNPDQGSF